MMATSRQAGQSQSPSTLKQRLRSSAPAEWATALDVYEELKQLDRARRLETARSRAYIWAQFIVGIFPGAILGSLMSKDDAALPSMLIAGILALSAIMVGFVVTLMLFAGTVGKPELLALEELKRHVNRVKYLLSSQMTTLVFALALSVFSTIWLVAYISKADHLIQGAVGAVTGGLLSISVMRTLLLPFQIYELHSATFIDLLKSAANETRKHYGH